MVSSARRRIRFTIAIAAIIVSVTIVVIALQNVLTAAAFPRLSRVETDFSAAYLQRELSSLAAESPQTIFLGDSVLWGFRLPAERSAVSILAQHGCACRNLAFKSGSPPNAYAVVKLLIAKGIRPKAVVIEVNQKVLNASDASYQALHPAVAALALPLLAPADRATLKSSAPRSGPLQSRIDALLSSVWLTYAMRSDIRELIAPDADLVPSRPLTAEDLAGTYDLQPLTPKNVGVHYLTLTVRLLRRAGIPTIAFMTPTNHQLLHEYIDGPEYRRNTNYLISLLRDGGVRVLDLDAAFPTRDFLDESHLTAAGNERLAAILGAAIRR